MAIQKYWRVFALCLRNAVSHPGFRARSTSATQSYPARRGFPAGNDVGDVLKPSSEVDPKEKVAVSADASVRDAFSMAIIGRLYRTGQLLFWRRIVQDLVPLVSESDSNFYECVTCKKALEVTHSLGYEHHPIILVNDNDVAVKMINNAETSMQEHVAKAVDEVHELQDRFKPIRPRVVGRVVAIQDAVDILAKSGQPRQEQYKLKHVMNKIDDEVDAFPIPEKDLRDCM